GKHEGMLLLARATGEPLESYLDPGHPVQRMIFDRFAELLGALFEDPVPAIDGCSAPTPRIPLATLARAFALFSRGVDARGRPVPALVQIRDAMAAHPEHVAGEGRLDTLLMRRLPGVVVSKAGAEGMHAIAHVKRGIGIAVKIADGGRRALKPAVLAVLEQLALLTGEDREVLQPADEMVLKSYAGLVEGEEQALHRLEQFLGRRLGDPANPLLVSVRSGAPISMPGMMDTVLNLGLNDQTVEGLAIKSRNPRFAFDSYRRFIQMFSDVV